MDQIPKKLLEYCERSNFEGHDPYDGLNSRLFNALGFQQSAFLRLAWIQLFKQSPINFRPITGVAKSFNPKAGGLFLAGAVRLSKEDPAYKNICSGLWSRLKECAVKTQAGFAWGYNFDWQARAFFVPKGTPNIVTTVYVGNALIDYYKLSNDQSIEVYIKGARDFILDEMILWEKTDSLCFAYIPNKKTEVHNANLWAAAYLARVDALWPREGTSVKVKKAVAFSLSDIQEDGYWPYGTSSHHRWMDNFHTGFNLETLMTIQRIYPEDRNEAVIQKVFDYYYDHFFMADGTPKYYPNKLYPIDIHTIAESIIICSKIRDPRGLPLAEKILNVALSNFWDNGKQYFYYQKGRFIMNKIPYIRWAQAWMFYALSVYTECVEIAKKK